MNDPCQKQIADYAPLRKRLFAYEKQWSDMNFTIGQALAQLHKAESESDQLRAVLSKCVKALDEAYDYCVQYSPEFEGVEGQRIRKAIATARPLICSAPETKDAP